MSKFSVVQQLSEFDSLKKVFHEKKKGVSYPSATALCEILDIARAILFPGYYGTHSVTVQTLPYYIGVNVDRLATLLEEQVIAGMLFGSAAYSDYNYVADIAENTVERFLEKLPEMRQALISDVESAYNGDPAAKSYAEIVLCYPAIKAISAYRIAHELLLLNVPLIPRMITEMGHSETGIDINPGARIGHHFTIDHGTGVVIGETCIIGNNVKIYQGVTLGAKSFELDEYGNPVKNIDRHPIIEDDVVIYANATILGRITIGQGSVIGGNVWVTNNVPAGSKVVQKRGGQV